MATFATESDVRLKFQLNDAVLVTSDVIELSIGDAHQELLRFLDEAYAVGEPPYALVLGETLLAGTHLFRSLAAKEAFEQKHVRVGGQQLQEGARFASLNAVAALTEDEAWRVLAPYLAAFPPRSVAAVTASTPVLGTEE
ncbi:MAG TPA: hypothetical protein ENN80_05180 [Candidatus Hydrogenedentes bacterium]|nr:hypothetical protein [Candidatus Hydrogenedentota bacterium]